MYMPSQASALQGFDAGHGRHHREFISTSSEEAYQLLEVFLRGHGCSLFSPT